VARGLAPSFSEAWFMTRGAAAAAGSAGRSGGRARGYYGVDDHVVAEGELVGGQGFDHQVGGVVGRGGQ
jgi:hypothetical protein